MQVIVSYIYDKYDLESLPCLFFKNNYNSLSVLINSICCFLLFKSLHIKKGAKIIQFIAPLTFGIYLIHFNVGIVPWLYSEFLPIKEVAGTEGFSVLLSLLLFGFIVFAGSAILEMARQYIYRIINNYFNIEDYILNIKCLKFLSINNLFTKK